MITDTTTPAQRTILRELGGYVTHHPVAVLPLIFDDGYIKARIVADDAAAEKAAVTELAAQLHLDEPEQTVNGWVSTGWAEVEEVDGLPLAHWGGKNDGKVSIWCARQPVRECPACRQYPCKCAKPKPGTGNGRGAL